MYLRLDERGEFSVAREVNPYNMKGVPTAIPMVDYMPVGTSFDGKRTFDAQAFNAANELMKTREHKKHQQKAAQKSKSSNRHDANYRARIAQEQSFKYEDPQEALLEEAILRSMSGADFQQLDKLPQERNLANRFPGTDFERYVCSLPIGHPEGTVPVGTPMWRNEAMQPYGTQISSRQMAGLWDDITGAVSTGWDQLMEQGKQEVVKAGTQQLSQILGQSTTPGTPGVVPQQSASVVPVPPMSLPSSRTVSSIDPKYLIYGGIGLAGLVVLVLLLRR